MYIGDVWEGSLRCLWEGFGKDPVVIVWALISGSPRSALCGLESGDSKHVSDTTNPVGDGAETFSASHGLVQESGLPIGYCKQQAIKLNKPPVKLIARETPRKQFTLSQINEMTSDQMHEWIDELQVMMGVRIKYAKPGVRSPAGF